jgi:hypothetical protein
MNSFLICKKNKPFIYFYYIFVRMFECKKVKLKKKTTIENISIFFLIDRNIATKFVNDICNTLNINFTCLLALLSGTLHVTNKKIRKVHLNLIYQNDYNNYLFYFDYHWSKLLHKFF